MLIRTRNPHGVKQAVYDYIKRAFGLRREDIPAKPERFEHYLDELFVDGSYLIKERIVEEITRYFQLGRKVANPSVAEVILEARNT